MVLSTQLASAWFAVVRRIVNLHQGYVFEGRRSPLVPPGWLCGTLPAFLMSDAWISEVVVPLQEPVSVQPNMPFTGHKEETMPGGQNPGAGWDR